MTETVPSSPTTTAPAESSRSSETERQKVGSFGEAVQLALQGVRVDVTQVVTFAGEGRDQILKKANALFDRIVDRLASREYKEYQIEIAETLSNLTQVHFVFDIEGVAVTDTTFFTSGDKIFFPLIWMVPVLQTLANNGCTISFWTGANKQVAEQLHKALPKEVQTSHIVDRDDWRALIQAFKEFFDGEKSEQDVQQVAKAVLPDADRDTFLRAEVILRRRLLEDDASIDDLLNAAKYPQLLMPTNFGYFIDDNDDFIKSAVRMGLPADAALLISAQKQEEVREFVTKLRVAQEARLRNWAQWAESSIQPTLTEAITALGLPSRFDSKLLRKCYRALIRQISPDHYHGTSDEIKMLRTRASQHVNACYQLLSEELNKSGGVDVSSPADGEVHAEKSRSKRVLTPEELIRAFNGIVVLSRDGLATHERRVELERILSNVNTIEELMDILNSTTEPGVYYVAEFERSRQYHFAGLISNYKHVFLKATLPLQQAEAQQLDQFVTESFPKTYRIQELVRAKIVELQHLAAAKQEDELARERKKQQLMEQLQSPRLTTEELSRILLQLQTDYESGSIFFPKGKALARVGGQQDTISLAEVLETRLWLEDQVSKYPGPVIGGVDLLVTLERLVSRLPNEPFMIDTTLALDAIQGCKAKKTPIEFGAELFRLRSMRTSASPALAYLGSQFAELGIDFT